jgi:hypothetical protein
MMMLYGCMDDDNNISGVTLPHQSGFCSHSFHASFVGQLLKAIFVVGRQDLTTDG